MYLNDWKHVRGRVFIGFYVFQYSIVHSGFGQKINDNYQKIFNDHRLRETSTEQIGL